MLNYVKLETDFRSREVCSKIGTLQLNNTYTFHVYVCVQILYYWSYLAAWSWIVERGLRLVWLYGWYSILDSHTLTCRRNIERNFSRAHSSHPGENYFSEKLSLRRLSSAAFMNDSHFLISNFSSTWVIVQVLRVFFINFINQQLVLLLWMHSVKCLILWFVQGQDLMKPELNGT